MSLKLVGRRLRHHARGPVACIALAVTLSCEGGITPPSEGTLSVSAATSGAVLDPDGYRIGIDDIAGLDWTVPSNGSVLLTGVPLGGHALRLRGEAANCIVHSPNPRWVVVTAEDTVAAPFNVTCIEPPGAIRLRATATGAEPDEVVSYQLNGASTAYLLTQAPGVVLTLAPGQYTLTVSGVAENCSLVSQNPQTLTVASEDTLDVHVELACALPAFARILVPTTGTDIDSLIAVSIDGAVRTTLAFGDSVTIKVPSGLHAVGLEGLAPNCSATGGNPVEQSFEPASLTRVAIPVSCIRFPTLRVTVTTTGATTPAGTVFVDWECDDYYYGPCGYLWQAPAPANGSVSIKLPPGDHAVWFGALPFYCTVAGTMPRAVTTTVGAITDIAFTVTCH